MEGGLESEYGDDSSLYYSQQSMFPPHRSEKDVSPFCSLTGAFIRFTVKLEVGFTV